MLKLKKFRGSLASPHINFFTKATLVKTVERSGWQINMVRGFHFKVKVIDILLNLVYPHFYIIASLDSDFEYKEKRLKELEGYTGNIKVEIEKNNIN